MCISSEGIVKWEETPEESTLTIENLQETNGGKYMCEAKKDTMDSKFTAKASLMVVVLPRECNVFYCPASGHLVNCRATDSPSKVLESEQMT